MLKIEMTGGLGNQLFVYALYRTFQLEGVETSLDLSWYNNINDSNHAKYHLDVFDTKVTKYTLPKYIDLCRQFLRRRKCDRLFAKIGLLKKKWESSPGEYDPTVFDFKKGYLTGTWQTEQYFLKHKDILRKELTYVGPWANTNSEYKTAIENSESIAVHIRRGDYLKFSKLYGNICTDEYYSKAVDYLRHELKDRKVQFFVFSDDIEWCRNELFKDSENVTYVTGNNGDTSYMDLVLMSLCKHHILANSSFSWWGEWLSIRDGITIAPKVWLNGSKTPDVWRKHWLVM